MLTCCNAPGHCVERHAFDRRHIWYTTLAVAAVTFLVPRTSMAQPPLAQVGPYTVESDRGEVNVERVIPYRAEARELLGATLSYSFPGRDSVRVAGVGTLPAVGEIGFLTTQSQLSFEDAITGQHLAFVPLQSTVVAMSAADLSELPARTTFPAAYRQAEWSGVVPFPSHALGVLDEHFRSGYEASESAGIAYYATTYRYFGPLPTRSQCKVAALVSFPFGSQRTAFRIQVTARERLLRDEWGEVSSKPCRDAVEAFSSLLLQQLRGAEANRTDSEEQRP